MTEIVEVGLRLLPHAFSAPVYGSDGAAGADLVAALPEDEPLTLAPGGYDAVPTGVVIELPQGYEAQLRPRSGLARKHGVTVLNAPGTIDWDYRGEILALLINHGSEPVAITRGMRIAQLVVAPVSRAAWALRETLSDTTRGAGGFGSTGLGSKAAIDDPVDATIDAPGRERS